jgi:SPP1 gp7 family putative phage head morphogenesis protein
VPLHGPPGAGLLAKHFATKVAERSDLGLQASLRKAGFTVKFTMTPAANDILQATIQQNVGLIKSIASEHLSKVQGLVMRSVQAGRDIGGLTKDIEEQFGITRRRAVLIARTQNALATASMNKARALEVGITEAVWLHSHAGRTPRPSHVKANGKKYDIAKGMYLDGEWLQPGQAINCRCLSKPLIPGLS